MQEPHAITRARERYGLELTIDDLNRIAADIAAGKTMKLGSQPDGSMRHAVLCGDRALIVVSKHVVLTVLPKERRQLPAGVKCRAPQLPPKSARKRW